MSKINNKLLMCIILGIMLISNAAALGITPGRSSINFEPNVIKICSYKTKDNVFKRQ